MTDDPYISRLASVDWGVSPPPDAAVMDWLMEHGSMTRRFEQHCGRVAVRLVREGLVGADALGDAAGLLPQANGYWLREVILSGDGQPWLAGRTLIPAESLSGEEQALTTLGNVPLGRWLFRGPAPMRKYIHVGKIGDLWARRSCFLLNGKPLLLTELFLPDAPLYRSSAAGH